jgi:predicted permease
MNPERAGTLELTFADVAVAETDLTGGHRVQAVGAMIDRLAADPSIDAVGVVNDLPLRGGGGIGILVEPDGMPKPKGFNFARYLIASGGYFDAMGIRLLRGRTFATTDDTIGPRAAIINETMAKTFWPNVDPIGRLFHLASDSIRYTVVGIVADVREGDLVSDPGAQMYFSAFERPPKNMALVARSRLPKGTLLSRLTGAVHFAAPRQAVFNVRMMDDVVSTSVAPRRTNTTLIVVFGALALVLSAFGVYAVVSYSVARRTREFGIRSALGAKGTDIVALVTGEMVAVVGAGLVLGLTLAWALVRTISSLLFEVPAHDLQIFFVVPPVLIVPAAVATLVPALRAMRVSPTEVMRAE